MQPIVSKVDSTQGVGPPHARDPDRCAIVYRGSRRQGEFHVVVTEAGGSVRSVARSPTFRAPRVGAIRRSRAARLAHELLVRRLEACGWTTTGPGETWYELSFVRLRTAGNGTVRGLVRVMREVGQAVFVAEELDTYGHPTTLVVSLPFSAPGGRPVQPSRQAKAALKQLVRRMEPEGWKVAGTLGKEWYAISLWRPAGARRSPAPDAVSEQPL